MLSSVPSPAPDQNPPRQAGDPTRVLGRLGKPQTGFPPPPPRGSIDRPAGPGNSSFETVCGGSLTTPAPAGAATQHVTYPALESVSPTRPTDAAPDSPDSKHAAQSGSAPSARPRSPPNAPKNSNTYSKTRSRLGIRSRWSP